MLLTRKTYFDDAISLFKLRQELAKLIIQHTARTPDTLANATAQSTTYENVLHGLNVRIERICFNFLIIFTNTDPNAAAKRVHGTSEVPTGDCFLGQSRGGGTAKDCIRRAGKEAVVLEM